MSCSRGKEPRKGKVRSFRSSSSSGREGRSRAGQAAASARTRALWPAGSGRQKQWHVAGEVGLWRAGAAREQQKVSSSGGGGGH